MSKQFASRRVRRCVMCVILIGTHPYEQQRRPQVLATGEAASGALRRQLRATDHRARRGLLRLRRRWPRHPRFHLGPDERPAGPFASRHRGGGHGADPLAGPPLQRHAVAAGGGARRRNRAARAARAGALPAAEHRRGVERGGAAHGQARHGPARGGGLHAVMAWHDRQRGRGHLQRRPQGLRAGGSRLVRHPGAERLPPALHDGGGRARLAPRTRRRLRAGRPSVHRRARRLHCRAHPQQRRHPRTAAGLHGGAQEEVRGARHALDPRRGADRRRPHRADVRVRARRRHPRHPHALQDAGRGPAAGGDGDDRRDRGRSPCARLPVLYDARVRPAAGGSRPEGAGGRGARRAGRTRTRRRRAPAKGTADTAVAP